MAFRWAVWCAIALLSIYAGTYYAMLIEPRRPALSTVAPFMGLESPEMKLLRFELTPKYRFGGDWSTAFFKPMHAFDRMLRPDYWSPFATKRGGGREIGVDSRTDDIK